MVRSRSIKDLGVRPAIDVLYELARADGTTRSPKYVRLRGG